MHGEQWEVISSSCRSACSNKRKAISSVKGLGVESKACLTTENRKLIGRTSHILAELSSFPCPVGACLTELVAAFPRRSTLSGGKGMTPNNQVLSVQVFVLRAEMFEPFKPSERALRKGLGQLDGPGVTDKPRSQGEGISHELRQVRSGARGWGGALTKTKHGAPCCREEPINDNT